jgi:succinyldiaminopimelate transaminase
MRLNPVLAQLGAYSIATVQERARDLRAAGVQVVDFSIGDPREPTPPFIAEALKNAVPEVSQYPATAGIPELRFAVSDYLDRRFGVTVDPTTEVIPTSGSKEAVFNTPLAFIDRDAGDVVVYGTPGYPIYDRGARLAGAAVHPVVLRDDFVLRVDDVPDEVWAKTKLVWICSPHNPTGAVTPSDELAKLLERCREVDALLLSDECYVDVYEPAIYPEGPPSTLQVAGDSYRNLLAFYSCSKRSGMTGYRSGAIVGDPEAIAALKQLRTGTGTVSQEFVQTAAAAAWSDDTHAAERRAIFSEKRAVLRKAFEDLGYATVASQAGLYLWIRVGDDLAATDALLEGGVVVSPGRFFGEGGEGYLRLALVPTVEECELAVEVIHQCLRRGTE